jgi:hypothetical protein
VGAGGIEGELSLNGFAGIGSGVPCGFAGVLSFVCVLLSFKPNMPPSYILNLNFKSFTIIDMPRPLIKSSYA